MRIVVLGYIVRGPLGGLVWHHLQYVVGLKNEGHDVYLVEDSDDYASCYNPNFQTFDYDPSYGLVFTDSIFESMGLGDRWAYYDAHKERWHGPCAEHILDMVRSADLLLNLSGINPLRPWLMAIPQRVLIDTDPVFTQLRHLTDPTARNFANLHTSYFSFGENINSRCNDIPEDSFLWRPTRQPVVLNAWPVTAGSVKGKFTTIMQWESYPPQQYQGKTYGMKSASFEEYSDLPAKVDETLEMALGSPSAPHSMLTQKGWHVCDPLKVTKSPWSYQKYIQQSKAEFSVAKHGYVVSQSGWFSERSACYLASGRPVVIQDTGFSKWMETGAGVLAFKNVDEAVAAIEEVNRRYEFHCKKARDVVEEYFDSKKVLTKLIKEAT